MNSTFFRTKHQYFDTFHKAIARWLKHHGLPNTLATYAESFSQNNGNSIFTTYTMRPDSLPILSSNYNNSWVTRSFFITQTMNFNISAYFVPGSTSVDAWLRGSHLNSFDHYHTTLRTPSATSLNKLSQIIFARNTNGDSVPNSLYLMAWCT